MSITDDVSTEDDVTEEDDALLCVFVHGVGNNEEVLHVCARCGVVASTYSLLQEFHGLRPPGQSALIQLDLGNAATTRPTANTMLSMLAKAGNGLWIEQAARPPTLDSKTQYGETVLRSVHVGMLLRPNKFVEQVHAVAGMHHAPTCKVSPQQKAVILTMRVPPIGSLVKVRMNFSTMADFVLVDSCSESDRSTSDLPMSVYLLTTRPPLFFTVDETLTTRDRRRRMPFAPFGFCMVYKLQFAALEEAKPLLGIVQMNGLRVCYARIADMVQSHHDPHSSVVPGGVPGGGRWCDSSSSAADLEDADTMRLLQALGSGAFPDADPRLHHALLYALSEQALTFATGARPSLLAYLRTLPGHVAADALAGLVPVLRSKQTLFADLVTLVEELVEGLLNAENLGRPSNGFASPAVHDPFNFVTVQRVRVTPTRALGLPPQNMLSNRILRQFATSLQVGGSVDDFQFLRVEFTDEDGGMLRSKEVLKDMLQLTFTSGVRLGNRTFQVLHWSNSNLRSVSCWMHATDAQYTREKICAWPFDPPAQAASWPTHKLASRLALFFTASFKTIDLPRASVRTITDVKKGDYCFTDGAGRMSEECAAAVTRCLRLDAVPAAFQVRYGGAKGVLVVYPQQGLPSQSLPGKEPRVSCKSEVELRPSMIKFQSGHESLEVVSWSHRIPCFLNQQLILLLLARGVPAQVFLLMQEHALLDAARVFSDELAAERQLATTPFNCDADCTHSGQVSGVGQLVSADLLRKAGVSVLREPMFATLLHHLYRQEVRQLRVKSRIPVPDGALLMGVPDESLTLEEGQVFVQVGPAAGSSASPDAPRVVTGPVAVSRNPCLHPGDVQLMEAVPCPAMSHVVDCVVFAVKGARPPADACSGGDLDGDLFWVVWDPNLLPRHPFDPMDYNPPEASESMSSQDMPSYYIRCTTDSRLGAIGDAHRIQADLLGAESEVCVELAKLHSLAVDAPKTGMQVVVPQELLPKRRPIWMDKDEAEDNAGAYEPSSKVMQRLHDYCPQEASSLYGATGEPVNLDPRLVVEGHEEWLEEARKLRDEYNARLMQIMQRFKLRSESEVLTGLLARWIQSPKERRYIRRMVSCEFDALVKDFCAAFFASPALSGSQVGGLTPTQAQQKASAWYVAAYSAPEQAGVQMLSFAWLAAEPLLHTVARPDAPPAAARVHANTPLVQALEDSMRSVYESVRLNPAQDWLLADEMRGVLQGATIDAELVPAPGLESVGLCKTREAHTFLLTTRETVSLQDVQAALQLHSRFEAAFVDEEEEESSVRVPPSNTRPAVVILKLDRHAASEEVRRRTARDRAATEVVCGWLAYYPELEPVCYVLGSWAALQPRSSPLRPLDVCNTLVNFLRRSSVHLHSEPPPVSARTWAFNKANRLELEETRRTGATAGPQPSELEREFDKERAFCPGQVALDLLAHLAETATWQEPAGDDSEDAVWAGPPGTGDTEAARREAHQACLRAYLQICMDHHVGGLLDGAAVATLRTRTHTICKVRVRLSEELVARISRQVMLVLACREPPVIWEEVPNTPTPGGSTLEHPQTKLPTIKIAVRVARHETPALLVLIEDLRRRLCSPTHLSFSDARERQLPINRHKNILVETIAAHPVVIVRGSTGGGKSTSVPRMLLEDADVLALKHIVCTQPRRIGATSLAQYVAELCECQLGQEVGYRIGGSTEVHPHRTCLVYQTTAIAMIQFLRGVVPCTHLVVDEVHNRTIFDDILLAVVRMHMREGLYKGLKLVLMSAATDCNALARYFATSSAWKCNTPCQLAPIVDTDRLSGAIYPIREFYLEDIPSLRHAHRTPVAVSSAELAEFLWELHQNRASSSRFLVFLPGVGDIRNVCEELNEIQDEQGDQLELVQLHSGMTMESQLRTLNPAQSSSKRMVILATDVVESSVTIPAVDVVVDSMMHKRKKWHEKHKEYQLCREYITQDEALQRRGRTGRLGPGEVYRLISKRMYPKLLKHVKPQMESTNIAQILLLLADSPLLDDPRQFLLSETLNPPEERHVTDAYRSLMEVGALKSQEGRDVLVPSEFGRLLQKLPMQPELGLLVWNGVRFGYIEDCEIIAGVVQRGLPFIVEANFNPREVREVVHMRRACCPDSDLIAGLRAYRAWQNFLNKEPAPSVLAEAQWCWNHYLSVNTLQGIEEMVVQVRGALAEMDLAPKLSELRQRDMRERRREHLRSRDKVETLYDAWNSLVDPAASLQRLIGVYNPKLEQYRVLNWCIAVSFAAFSVQVTGPECKSAVYKCRKKRAHELSRLLTVDLGLHVLKTSNMSRGDARVEFTSSQEAHVAISMGAIASGWTFPYGRSPRLTSRTVHTPREAYLKCNAIMGSNSVCVPVAKPPCLLVGASVLVTEGTEGKSDCAIFTQLTSMPPLLLPVALAVRSTAAMNSSTCQVAVSLGGQQETYDVHPELLSCCHRMRAVYAEHLTAWSSGMSSATERVVAGRQQKAISEVMTLMRTVDRIAARDAATCCAQSMKFSVDVPKYKHGALIGSRGSTLKKLLTRHPTVNVDVPHKNEDRPVIMEGTLEAVQAFCRSIEQELCIVAKATPFLD